MADQSRPVTGYPASFNNNPNGYPTTATAGTGYPYAAPPPQTAYYTANSNPYYAPAYPDPRATFFRRLFGIIIASFIIAGTIIFIVWLILRPRLPEFRVDSVSLSNFNLSSSLITGNWDVRYTVRNPNHKITLYYDQIQAGIYYRSQSLSETTLSPFVQGKRNQTTARANFAAAGAYLEGWAADGINSDRKENGRVDFNVRMLARVRYRAGAWKARKRFLRVYCGVLPVTVSANGVGGTMSGGAKQCKVGI